MTSRAAAYFRLPETDVKVPLREVPTNVAPPMIMTLMSAARRPYSMAVAPDSSLRKFTRFFIGILSVLCGPAPRGAKLAGLFAVLNFIERTPDKLIESKKRKKSAMRHVMARLTDEYMHS